MQWLFEIFCIGDLIYFLKKVFSENDGQQGKSE